MPGSTPAPALTPVPAPSPAGPERSPGSGGTAPPASWAARTAAHSGCPKRTLLVPPPGFATRT
eukprot:12761330-Alexandrium_andersonii.AAC.1